MLAFWDIGALGRWAVGGALSTAQRAYPREELVSADADPSKGAGAAVREAVERELSRWGASGTASGFGAGRRRSWEAPDLAVRYSDSQLLSFCSLTCCRLEGGTTGGTT